jgi:hypothetical protein
MISEENKELANELKKLKADEKKNIQELTHEASSFFPNKIKITLEEIRVTKVR